MQEKEIQLKLRPCRRRQGRQWMVACTRVMVVEGENSRSDRTGFVVGGGVSKRQKGAKGLDFSLSNGKDSSSIYKVGQDLQRSCYRSGQASRVLFPDVLN